MNLNKRFKLTSLLTFLVLVVSCASIPHIPVCCSSTSLNIIPPTNSFVKITNHNDNNITTGTASGAIISQINDSHTIIATAKHVCKKYDGSDENIRIYDIDNIAYEGLVLVVSKEHDLCLITSKIKIDRPTIKISSDQPVPGNVSYNLAAPYGIHGEQMVLIFHGHYSGKYKIPEEKYLLDLHTVPGGGGSSGSPIFNDKWELTGIVSRGFRPFNHVMLSVGWEHIQEFLRIDEQTLTELISVRLKKEFQEKLQKMIDDARKIPNIENK